MIQHFFNQYREEADKHFSYEEQHVFPYVEQLASGQTAAYRIHDFEESHGDIEEKLADLISLIIKYLPGDTLPRERASILSTSSTSRPIWPRIPVLRANCWWALPAPWKKV